MVLPHSIFMPAEGEITPAAITIYRPDGLPITVNSNQGTYEEVRALIAGGLDDISVIDTLVNPSVILGEKLTRLSDNVTFDGSNIFYDHDPLDEGVSRFIQRIIEKHGIGDEDRWKPAIRFLEKLYQNPSEDSRKSLYPYLRRHDFTITNDGDIIAYKGVRADYRSIHAGPGVVNGIRMTGHLLNEVGSTIEIPRSYVDADRTRGCSQGLHAGTYKYANGFSQGILLRVRINPRDVVSVPLDGSFHKIRVSRYVVLEASRVEVEDTHYDFDSAEEDDWAADPWLDED